MNTPRLKPDEVATLLGVSKWTVYELIRRNQIQAIDVSADPTSGRPQWRIKPEAIHEFELQRQNVKAKPTRVEPAPPEARRVIPRKADRHYV